MGDGECRPPTVRPDDLEHKQANTRNRTKIMLGFGSGVIATTMLNPWDRALFLSVLERRPFLHWKNLRNPYQGYMQTLVQRSVSSGLYFPLEHIFIKMYSPYIACTGSDQRTTYLVAGCSAGVINAIILNPLSYTKYHSWSSPTCRDFKSSFTRILKNQGLRGFYRGSVSTMFRDFVFGGLFSTMRNTHQPEETSSRRFAINFASCAVATLFSSPWNFVRNMQYGTSTTMPVQGMGPILGALWVEAKAEPTLLRRASHLQQRLRIGWGTARVSVGMALVDLFYTQFIQIFGGNEQYG